MTIKHASLLARTLVAAALLTILAACSHTTGGGSATFQFNARALASRTAADVPVTMRAEVQYTIGGTTTSTSQAYDSTAKTDFITITIDNLPLGETVLFDANIYQTTDGVERPILKSKQAVSAVITETTYVSIELAYVTDDDDADEEKDADDTDKNAETPTATDLITVPAADKNLDASTGDGFYQLLVNIKNGLDSGSAEYVGKRVQITLKNDITYTATTAFAYNANSDTAALIIDLNGHTLTLAGALTDTDAPVFDLQTTTYIKNGTIADGTTTSGSNTNIFTNKSTLYLKNVSIQGGAHKAVYQGTEDASAVLYVQGGTFSGFSGTDIAPIWIDRGYVVISGAAFNQNGSAQAAIVNKGCVVLTGNTTVQSGETGLVNDGTMILVGATVGTSVTSSGTLALLNIYEHTTGGKTEQFSLNNGLNMIIQAAKITSSGSLVLGKNASITNISLAVGNGAKIYSATDAFAYPTVGNIMLNADDYPLSVNGQTGYADVFGRAESIKIRTDIDAFVQQQVVDITADTAKAFTVSGGTIESVTENGDTWYYAKMN